MVVVAVHDRAAGTVVRYELDRTFTIGSTPGCDVPVPWDNPWMPGQQIFMRIAIEGYDVRIADTDGLFSVDDVHPDLAFPFYLQRGSVLTAGLTLELVIEAVPERPDNVVALKPRFDRGGADEFDADMHSIEAAERQAAAEFAAARTREGVLITNLPDIHRVLGLIHPTLGDLEQALGIELSQPYQPHGHVMISLDDAPGPLEEIIASYRDDVFPPRGGLRRARWCHLDSFFIRWRTGRTAWQTELAAVGVGFTITPNPTGDGFVVVWRNPPAPPFDNEARGYWIGELVDKLRTIDTMRELGELFAAAPTTIGVTFHGKTMVVFDPPVEFGLLTMALAMGPYDLKTDFSDHSFLPSWIDWRHGRWRLHARIDPRDSGLRVVTITPDGTRR